MKQIRTLKGFLDRFNLAVAVIGLTLWAGAAGHLYLSNSHPAQLSAAHNPKLSNLAANTSADAVCAQLNSGFLDIYSGTQPATGDTVLSGNTLLASLTINATACGSASSGVATFNAITSDSDADATGTATFARFYKSDHTTKVYDVSVGTSGADINLATTSIVQHAVVSISALTYTQNKG